MYKLIRFGLFFATIINSYASSDLINIYIAANYLGESTANSFQKLCHCQINQNYFNENDEMLAKMAAGANKYDIIVPTAYAVNQLAKMNKIQPLDLKKIPNIRYINQQFLKQNDKLVSKYSVPYAYDNVFLAYNKKQLAKLGIVPNSWAVIFEPKYLTKLKGRVTVFNSPKNVFATALLYLGKDPNSTNIDDLGQAQKIIRRAAPYWAKFDSDTYYRSLSRGNIWLAMSYSVDIFKTIKDMRDSKQEVTLAALLQKEGNMYELDNLVIPSSVTDTKLAYQFINHVLAVDSAIELANQTGASITNEVSLTKIDPEVRAIDWIYPKDMQKMHSFKPYDPKTRILINEVWLEIQMSASCN